MATSGVRDSAFTVASLIGEGLSLIQVGVGGETVEAEYLASGITTLKLMARAFAVDGIRLWLNETQAVTFVDGTATYTLSPRALEIYEAFRRSGTGDNINDVPIRILTKEEYERLPNKATEGAPYAVYMNRQRTTSTVTFYPVPGAGEVADSMTGRVVVKRQIEDVTAGAEDWEFPPEWAPALTYNFAVWAAPKFNKEASETVKGLAASLYDALSGQDREGSVYMRVSRRGRR